MKKIYYGIAFLSIILVSLIIAWGTLVLQSIPENQAKTLVYTDKNGVILTYISNPYGWRTPYVGSIDNEFVQSLLKIEDKRYYSHIGVDIASKGSAVIQNIQGGGILRGGSTITEQYIKNMYFPTESRTYIQKGKEAILGFLLSIKKDKKSVLRKYLDTLYFGNRIYGIDTAIQLYFGKSDIQSLSKDEIVTLLALIKYPGTKDLNDSNWQQYRNQIIERLGWKSELENKKVVISFESPTSINLFPILTTRIQKEIDRKISGEANNLDSFLLDKSSEDIGNQSVFTLSIDYELQKYTTNTLKSLLAPLEVHNVTNGAVYIYQPLNHKILAYVGNRSENGGGSSIDMITRERSVGSLLKPFLYLEALEKGAEIDTLLLDSDRIYDTDDGNKKYIPLNYTLKAYGPVRLREALGNSLNMAAVRLTEAIGLDAIYRKLVSYGIKLSHESTYYGYGLIIGGAEVSLENVVESFSHLIFKETTCEKNLGECDKKHIANLFLLNEILSNPLNRAKSFGINSILNSSIPMAVKTGTSTDFRDNWTLSYHKDAIIGVWIGNVDSSPMVEVSGITGAAPIWHTIAEYMIKRGFIKKTPVKQLPTGVIESYLCLDRLCLRKEKTYKKSDIEGKSRILDKLYYKNDFFTPPNEEEIEKWNIRN